MYKVASLLLIGLHCKAPVSHCYHSGGEKATHSSSLSVHTRSLTRPDTPALTVQRWLTDRITDSVLTASRYKQNHSRFLMRQNNTVVSAHAALTRCLHKTKRGSSRYTRRNKGTDGKRRRQDRDRGRKTQSIRRSRWREIPLICSLTSQMYVMSATVL